MKVLMLGWEFPPIKSGGLGTACFGLTRALAREGVRVSFVLPYAHPDSDTRYVDLIGRNLRVNVHKILSPLSPYIEEMQYSKFLVKQKGFGLYGRNLFEEVERFSEFAVGIAKTLDFDVIHCHDWITFRAGSMIKAETGKPLLVHVHATEFDRTGGHVNQRIYELERMGMHAADRIITVSNFTKSKLLEHYGLAEHNIRVVHNGIDFDGNNNSGNQRIMKDDKVVLFLGRLTMQKGADYFIEAARKCIDVDPKIKFIIAGTGDMMHYLINKTADLGIADKVLFAGFVKDDRLDQIYRMADVYVMPSVSEPFGLTPLEAMRNGTPVIISKQSGVSEVIQHALKVDFWDIKQLSNKILAVLKYEVLHNELKTHGLIEINGVGWDKAATKVIAVYKEVAS